MDIPYLPADVAAGARARGHTWVILRQTFYAQEFCCGDLISGTEELRVILGGGGGGCPTPLSATASPNPIRIPSGQYAIVRYTFTEHCGRAITLDQRTGQFFLPDGTPLMAESERMSQNIVVPARGTSSWDDNTYMPPDKAAEANRRGYNSVILRERFYGRDVQGTPVSIAIDVTIIFGETHKKPDVVPKLSIPPYAPETYASLFPGWSVDYVITLANEGSERGEVRLKAVSTSSNVSLKWTDQTVVLDAHSSTCLSLEVAVLKEAQNESGGWIEVSAYTDTGDFADTLVLRYSIKGSPSPPNVLELCGAAFVKAVKAVRGPSGVMVLIRPDSYQVMIHP